MKDTYILSICREFKCLGGDCPHTCCKGWHIPVDEATLSEYRKQRGAYGRALRFSVVRKNPPVMLKVLDKCPFYNCDGLCQFQANGELNLMPAVCRVFPRDGVEGNNEIEVTMELSCIEMARLFLSHPVRHHFEKTDQSIMALWAMDNDDPQFYEWLKKDREYILDFLWEPGTDLAERWQAIYAYSYHQHDLISRDRLDELSGVKITTDPGEQGIYYLNRDPTFAFFSIETIDRMIVSHINYGHLYIREPAFYRLIKSYDRQFREKYVNEADEFFDEKVRAMIDAGYGEKYRAYFSYCIQELYMKAYETYFTLRQILFAILYVQLLMMFDLVDFERRGGPADIDRQAQILMMCEKGIRHNPDQTRNLFEVIRRDFL